MDHVYMRMLVFVAALLISAASWRLPCLASAPSAEILRDEYGIPHIFAETEEAAFYAAGWAEAEDGAFFLYYQIIAAQGRLAEFVLPATSTLNKSFINEDIKSRALGYYDLSAEWRSLPPDVLTVLCSFVSGFNDAVVQLDKQGVFARALSIDGMDPGSVIRAFGPITPRDLVALGLRINGENALMNLTQDEEATRDFVGLEQNQGGSNAAALGPGIVKEHAALVYGDLHNPWLEPQRMLHLQIGPDVVFGQFTGPFIVTGRSSGAGMVFTRNGVDGADVFVEKINPDDPGAYLAGDVWAPFQTKKITLKVRNEPDRHYTLYYSRHGWMWDYPQAKKSPEYAHALRVAVLNPNPDPRAPMLFAIQRLRSMRVNSIYDHYELFRVPFVSQRNAIVADTFGNISSSWLGLVPVRRGDLDRSLGRDYSKPVPGWDTNGEWSGRMWSLGDPDFPLPYVMNPRGGTVHSANDAPWLSWGCGDLPARPSWLSNTVVSADQGVTSRGMLLRDLLCSHSVRSVDDVRNLLAFNTLCPDARDFIAAIERGWALHHADLSTLPPSADVRTLDRILRDWNARADVDQPGMTVMFHMKRITQLPWFPPGYTPSLPEMQAYLSDLESVAATMQDLYGALSVPWGRIHVLRIGGHLIPLPGGTIMIPALLMASANSRWDTRKIERDAMYGDSPNQTNSGLRGMILCRFGSSFIQVHIMDKNHPESYAISPLGQVSEALSPKSPHLLQQAQMFSMQQWMHVPLTRADVEKQLCPWGDAPGHEHKARTVIPVPAISCPGPVPGSMP